MTLPAHVGDVSPWVSVQFASDRHRERGRDINDVTSTRYWCQPPSIRSVCPRSFQGQRRPRSQPPSSWSPATSCVRRLKRTHNQNHTIVCNCIATMIAAVNITLKMIPSNDDPSKNRLKRFQCSRDNIIIKEVKNHINACNEEPCKISHRSAVS